MSDSFNRLDEKLYLDIYKNCSTTAALHGQHTRLAWSHNTRTLAHEVQNMAEFLPKFGVGEPTRRVEDGAFLRGQACYTDDIAPRGSLFGYVLRSPVAHAEFEVGDLDRAQNAPGVHLVLTGEDVAHLNGLKVRLAGTQSDGSKGTLREIEVLCQDRVRYVGDAVAFVVADSKAQAWDAAELIEVEYRELESNVDPARALEDDAPLVWPETTDNRCFLYRRGDEEACNAAFETADKTVGITLVNNRIVSNYMEPRSAIGEYRPEKERYVLTAGSQGVFSIRDVLGHVFDADPDNFQIRTPDVGGGFGPKLLTYREYALVLEAARRLSRPVKWTSERTEHFLTDAHGRDHVSVAEMALRKDGRFLGLRIRTIANLGAYTSQNGPFIPFIGSAMSTGVYDIPALDVRVDGVFTNTNPVDAFRGAGRPEAAFLLETLVDRCAIELDIARDEIRRRNFIPPDKFPYTTSTNLIYDVGEFEAHMDRALERADWRGFGARLQDSKSRGMLRGIGMSTYIEACAFAGSEAAYVTLNSDGSVTCKIGTQSNGQGHETVYAQFIAEKLNMDIGDICVQQGDSDAIPSGGGTSGSRSIPLGGPSAARAGAELANKITRLAAHLMDCDVADVSLEKGAASNRRANRFVSFAEIAQSVDDPEDLKATGRFVQKEATYPNGTHICEVEVDPETGTTRILRFVAVDDFGVTVNPLLLAGQIHGGIAQGVSQALLEHTVYDVDGQLLTATFMDYAMPRADNMPAVEFETRNVPSTTNELGIKGAGEAGTIGATPAVINALRDALHRGCGIDHIDMPATPDKIWRTIHNMSKQ